MKYLKDIFNLKNNKKYKITIIILVVIILILQTSLSINNKKIQVLNARINKLQMENKKDNEKSEIASNIDEVIGTEKEQEDNLNIDEEYENKKENILERYIEVGEKNNKKYSSEIIAGKEVLVFETMNLEMTDGQIEKSLKKINSDEFGFNIVKDKLGNKPYYKIYLIETNIGS